MWVYARKTMFCKGAATPGLNKVGGIMIKADPQGVESKTAYYQNQIDTIVATGSTLTFITTLAELIQRLAVAKLHIMGDIYDRGPGAHIILESLMQ